MPVGVSTSLLRRCLEVRYRAQLLHCSHDSVQGVTSTNGGWTAAPSFSFSDQALILPYFVRYIYIIFLSFISQLSKASDGFKESVSVTFAIRACVTQMVGSLKITQAH